MESGFQHSDVLIVGGGFAGMAAGTVLASRGHSVTVLDGGPAVSFRGELIHPAGARVLTALGLRPALLAAGAVSVKGFAAYSSAEHDPVLLPYSKEAGQGVAVGHHDLVKILRADFLARARTEVVQARAHGLVVRNGRVTGIRTMAGETLDARLVLVADGRHSRIRAQLGVETSVDLLSYTLAPDLEGDLLPHPAHGHVFVGAPGPILAYPYGPDRVRMCIDLPSGIKGGRRGLYEFVNAHYAAHVPEPLRTAMLGALERGAYSGSANHAISTKSCVARGVALIGDAGGCSHPVTAAGLTIALHDVTTLAECIEERGLSDAALSDYERRRYRFVRAREVFSQSLFEVLRGADSGSRGLRHGMFQYWRASARARRASMAILSGEDSRPKAFVTEYSRVMVRSVYEAIKRKPAPEVRQELVTMASTGGECLKHAMEKAIAAVSLEAARRPVRDVLLPVPERTGEETTVSRPPAIRYTAGRTAPGELPEPRRAAGGT